jgi:hypothetical protein
MKEKIMTTTKEMNSKDQASKKEKRSYESMRCANCGIRRMAEANPNSLMSRLWKWHTGWCPGWNAYQKALARETKLAN